MGRVANDDHALAAKLAAGAGEILKLTRSSELLAAGVRPTCSMDRLGQSASWLCSAWVDSEQRGLKLSQSVDVTAHSGGGVAE